MKKAIKIMVLMAGQYEISQGTKIDFQLDKQKQLYIAACEKHTFGIAKFVIGGRKEDLERLGVHFSGVALKVNIEKRLMKVKVVSRKELQMKWKKKN